MLTNEDNANNKDHLYYVKRLSEHDDHADVGDWERDIEAYNRKITRKCERHHWTVGLMDVENNFILFECNKCHIQHEIRGYFDEL